LTPPSVRGAYRDRGLRKFLGWLAGRHGSQDCKAASSRRTPRRFAHFRAPEPNDHEVFAQNDTLAAFSAENHQALMEFLVFQRSRQ
jgi:hypothetical protein